MSLKKLAGTDASSHLGRDPPEDMPLPPHRTGHVAAGQSGNHLLKPSCL